MKLAYLVCHFDSYQCRMIDDIILATQKEADEYCSCYNKENNNDYYTYKVIGFGTFNKKSVEEDE